MDRVGIKEFKTLSRSAFFPYKILLGRIKPTLAAKKKNYFPKSKRFYVCFWNKILSKYLILRLIKNVIENLKVVY